MNTLYIIRGVSGSGKTTLARKLAEELVCCYHEADQFFTNSSGNYNFNPAQLPRAHEWCREGVQNDLRGNNPTVVSNTFTTIKEIAPYIEMAKELDCKAMIITCTGQYDNVHGLTEAQVMKQRKRFASNWDLARHFKDEVDSGMLTFGVN